MPPLFLGCYWSDPFFLNEIWHWHIGLRWAIVALWATCWWILLKLYRCFKDGLEICILFFQNPEIIFYHFFRIFNLDIFRALILQICIWSIYLVSATPPTVFGESFWNFTVVFRMVWRYAYCFLRILKLFFLHFNLDIFSSLYATDMYREYMPCIGNPAYSFRPILLKLYRYFAAFLWFHMRNLSLAGYMYNCSGGASCMACSFFCSCRTRIVTGDTFKWQSFTNIYSLR